MKRKDALIWAKTNGRCWYCGCELVYGASDPGRSRIRQWYTADHIHPKTKGGANELDNLRPCCWFCNSQKNHKTVEEYRSFLAHKKAGIPHFSPEQWGWLESQGFVVAVPLELFWGEQQGIE